MGRPYVGISWKRASPVARGEPPVDSLGIPFRFQKYTAVGIEGEREECFHHPPRSRVYITRIALSLPFPLFSFFLPGRKARYIRTASGARRRRFNAETR